MQRPLSIGLFICEKVCFEKIEGAYLTAIND